MALTGVAHYLLNAGLLQVSISYGRRLRKALALLHDAGRGQGDHCPSFCDADIRRLRALQRLSVFLQALPCVQQHQSVRLALPHMS